MKNSIIVALLICIGFFSTCKKKEGSPPSTEALRKTVKLHGSVVDQDLKPISGAIVLFNGKSFNSNAGFYVFDEAVIADGRQVVKATMPGYFDAVVGFEALKDNSAQVKLVLIKKVKSGNIDAVSGGTINSGNAQVVLQSNGLEKNGSAFSGNANMFTYHYDLGDANFSQMTPGGDLNARDATNKERQLLSYGMIAVKMEDDNGNELQIATGKTATIKLPIDAGQLANAPATIKLWHLDELTGIWKEEGTATKQGSFYVGTVSHFSTWNTDHDEDVAWVKGRIVDCNDKEITCADASVSDATPGTSNRPQNNIQLEKQGTFIMRVASGFPLTINIYPYGDRTTPIAISVPPLSPGQTYDVGKITAPCGKTYTGTLVDCNNVPVSGMVRVETGLYSFNVDVWDGQLALQLALNKTYTITPYCMKSSLFGNQLTLTTGSSIGIQDLGNVPTCPCNGNTNGQADITKSFFTVDGGGFSNEQYHFNANSGTAIAIVSPADTIYLITASGTRSGNNENMSLTVQFVGTGPGTYSLENGLNGLGTAFVVIQTYTMSGSTITNQKIFTSKSGTVIVSAASTTSKPVNATFSGTFDFEDATTQQTAIVTISNGNIESIRFQ